MTVEELRERIKNQIVLHDGDLADWQWTPTGLPNEAVELGITDFRRLVNDVSRQLNSYFGRILELKEKVLVQARKQQKKLSNGDLDDIVKEAERLTLSRTFVVDQWVPALLNTITDVAVSSAVTTTTMPGAERKPTPVAPLTETDQVIRQKVTDILDDYERHIPVQTLRTLFRAIGGDDNVLAEAVQAYLSANFFAAESEPAGQTLKEKLLSTDWRHLSWWETKAAPVSPAVEPAKPVVAPESQAVVKPSGHPMVDTNYRTPPPSMPRPTAPPAPNRSNLSGLWGVLFAVVFLLIVYWLVKGSGKKNVTSSEDKPQTEQVDEKPVSRKSKKKKRAANLDNVATDTKKEERSGTESKPLASSKVQLPDYEELRDQIGDYGEQPAQKKGKWGLWRREKWFIKPIYDDITVFQDGRATVTLGDISFDIDRYGNRVR